MTNGSWSNDQQLILTLPGGAISGARIVIDGTRDAILVYGSDNSLQMSIAASAGTDSLGNTFPEGFAVSPDASPGLRLGLLGGTALQYFPSGVSGDHNSAGTQLLAFGAGTAAWTLLATTATQMLDVTDYVGVGLESNSDDGTSHTCIAKLNYIDTGGGVHSFVTVDATGGKVTAGTVTGVKPGSGSGRGSVAQPETWHSASSLLTSGWTTTGPTNPLRYRVEGVGSGQQVRLDGAVQTTGAGPWPAFGNVLVLPAGYIPAQNHKYVTPSAIDVTAGQSTVIVVTTGGVQAGQAFTAAGQQLYMDGVTFPLD